MGKWTPGKWEWIDDSLYAGPPDENGFRTKIIETDGGFYPPYDGDRGLIAAAPEMAELLSAICNGVIKSATDRDGSWSAVNRVLIDQARVILAKVN